MHLSIGVQVQDAPGRNVVNLWTVGEGLLGKQSIKLTGS